LGAFTVQLGYCLAVRAKIIAVYRELAIAHEGGCRKLLLNVDSLAVVSMLRSRVPSNVRH